MLHRVAEFETIIDNTPENVIAFIADIRNRRQYLSALKAITNVQGEPGATDNSWHWEFEAMGRSFQGEARCTQYQPGALYAFRTEGELKSDWTYRTEAAGEQTRLRVRVEYEIPDAVLAVLPPGLDPAAMEQSEAAQMFQSLNAILKRQDRNQGSASR